MKKLLVLALVLSMATLANAALTLTIDGPTQLMVGEVGTYTVGYSGQDITGADVDILSSLGTVGGGVIITTNRDTALDWTAPNTVSGNYEVTIMDDVSLRNLGSPLFSFQMSSAVAGPAVLSLVENSFMDMTFTPLDPGTATLGTLNVTVVPEPLTLGLLALGGLFIRRK